MTPPPLPSLRPRSATEIVDAAITLVRTHYGHLLQVAALGTIPSLVLAVAQVVFLPGMSLPADPTTAAPGAFAVLGGALVLSTIFGFATQGALSVSGLAALQGAPLPSVTAAFAMAFQRLPALVGAMVLGSAGVALALLPVIVGWGLLGTLLAGKGVIPVLALGGTLLVVLVAGLVLSYGYFALVTSLVVLERLAPVTALRRALGLLRGGVGRLAVVWAITLVLFFAVFGLAFVLASSVASDDVANALVTALAIPAVPIFGMVALVQYADARTRREGADLEAALADLAQSPG